MLVSAPPPTQSSHGLGLPLPGSQRSRSHLAPGRLGTGVPGPGVAAASPRTGPGCPGWLGGCGHWGKGFTDRQDAGKQAPHTQPWGSTCGHWGGGGHLLLPCRVVNPACGTLGPMRATLGHGVPRKSTEHVQQLLRKLGMGQAICSLSLKGQAELRLVQE